MTRPWRLGALALGASLALAGFASAGDDTFDLKLRKSPAATASELAPDQRAKADDPADTEDINLRYRLGYNRAHNRPRSRLVGAAFIEIRGDDHIQPPGVPAMREPQR